MLVIEYVVASQNLNSFLLPRAIIPQGLLPSTAQSSSKTYSDFSKVAVLKRFMAKHLLTPRSSNFLTSNLKEHNFSLIVVIVFTTFVTHII